MYSVTAAAFFLLMLAKVSCFHASSILNLNRIFRHSQTSLRMASTSTSEIKRFVLEYKYVEDILERRGPYRAKHLQLLEDLLTKGVLLGAGPFNPPTGGLFIFKDTSADSAEQFVKDDPYVENGLVTAHHIREWTKVIGDPSL